MKLPDALADDYRRERSHDPQLVVRSLYDLEGRLGATYVAADADTVTFFSRPSAGVPTCLTLSWPEIRAAQARSEGAFAVLELTAEPRSFTLRFSGWDKPQLDALVGLWHQHATASGPATTPAPTLSQFPASSPVATPAEAPPAMPPPPPAPRLQASPLAIFCAAVHALVECDHEIEKSELHFLTRYVPDPRAIHEGRELLERVGLDTLLDGAGDALNEAQRRCLMANLIGVAMLDGWLRSEEIELLGRFQTALRLSDADRERMFDVLMARNNLTVFPATAVAAATLESDGLTPLIAYCASMLALMEADDGVAPTEQELLTLTVPYPDDIHLGQDYLHAYGLDHLLGRLGAVLNAAQQQCLMANLIALVMADGVIRSAEQAMLERFKQAMNFPEADYAVLYEVLLVKNNLAVFAA